MAVYWFDLGIAYQRIGQVNEARAAYLRAQQLEPTNGEYADAATESK
jgi:Flp pilus assembly protein TadD